MFVCAGSNASFKTGGIVVAKPSGCHDPPEVLFAILADRRESAIVA